jgi:ribonuclease BN (tRNA processing enzyme)
MKVRVLGCSGAISKDCRTTSFLIDSDILIDAGTGVGDLRWTKCARIDHVFLTHSHLDHVAALPLMIDAVASKRGSPLRFMRLPAPSPRSRRISSTTSSGPTSAASPRPSAVHHLSTRSRSGQTLRSTGKRIEVLPAVHTVPAVGYAVTAGSGCWVFSGDTERNPAFWRRVNKMNVAALVIETAFSNREKDLARSACTCRPMRAGRGTGLHRQDQALPDLHHAHQAGRNRNDHGRDPALRPNPAVWAQRDPRHPLACAPGRSSSYERSPEAAMAAKGDTEQAFFDSQMLPPDKRGVSFEALFFKQLHKSRRASTIPKTWTRSCWRSARTSASC